MGNEKLIEFKNGIKNKKVAVLGIGGSNIPAIKYLHSMGAKIIAHDQKEKLGENANDILNLKNIEFMLGDKCYNNLNEADYILRTPGIKPFIPEIKEAVSKGVILTSEIELLVKLAPCKIIGITGSAGKTTTTTLVSELLKNTSYKVFVGGNIGMPLFDKLDEIKKDDIIVLELSSFQLMTMKDSPNISVITNIYEDHLDYHTDMNEYVDAKTNIFTHQKQDDVCIFWSEDEKLEYFKKVAKENNCESSIRYFSNDKIKNGVYVKDGKIIIDINDKVEEVIEVDKVYIKGPKNMLNICAAICAVIDFVSVEDIRKTLTEFKGVEHRLEYVDTKNGVKYYNDSISTTPGKAMAALSSFDEKIILIAGGSDKNLDYSLLGDKIIEASKSLILLGATKDKIKDAVLKSKKYNEELKIYETKNLKDALDIAKRISSFGDIVVMSPASASFDMYNNYKERGREFKDLVNKM